ncbi:hypothetical protein ACFOTA_22300 [Chitinophaga sp. GCM10012297]|uniref:Ig-like domain-containing protein n=1 Tax=Chitinophaga chungangae TaxID=2821488 RepID=A0ABS3YJV6_9BACT|nr:hypothetical protein [Chitinophaga chungangae]MBO9154964.1 hypothetical protein [Chitinophaga chungangae]
MKKIKLAVLAVCLLTGVVGAYGTSKRATNLYWIVPGVPKGSLTATISATPPTLNCSGGSNYPYLCRISSGETYFPEDEVWITEVTIISTYNQ